MEVVGGEVLPWSEVRRLGDLGLQATSAVAVLLVGGCEKDTDQDQELMAIKALNKKRLAALTPNLVKIGIIKIKNKI